MLPCRGPSCPLCLVGQSDHVKWGDLESGLGEVDLPFLKECFDRLLLNFTWWVNRKDPSGHNVFEGGFLGLDNIGVFDRSAALPTGPRRKRAEITLTELDSPVERWSRCPPPPS
jgi:hypothetical protein